MENTIANIGILDVVRLVHQYFIFVFPIINMISWHVLYYVWLHFHYLTIQAVQIRVAKFYNIGDRKTIIIHTKLRHRCSGLIADVYRVNLKNDPRCVCGHLFEDSIHFFLECPLYQHDRTSLFNYFNNIVPISIEYILFGCNEISEELNTVLFKSVQKFIRQTCRFNN